MKILGLDIASKTGYCLIEDGNLVNYGMLDILPEMNLFQRISFFETNLIKVLNDNNPDYVAIEDVIMGVSGVKTVSYLARLNGIAISCCYKKVQNNISLYNPPQWKANSFDGLNGLSKKYEIQVAVCRHFKLLDENTINEIVKPVLSIYDNTDSIKNAMTPLQEETRKYMAFLSKKKNLKSDFDRKSFERKIEENKKLIADYKKRIDDNKKSIDETYKSISLEIMSRCGLTADVSDSIGIAYCLYKQLTK